MKKKSKIILWLILSCVGVVAVSLGLVIALHLVRTNANCQHDFTKEIKASTCTTEGYIKRICKKCDYVDNIEILPSEHTDIIKVEEVLPTCVSNGKTEGSYCNGCETWIKPCDVIKFLGHDYEYQTIKTPTCSEKGQQQVVCKNCNDNFIKELDYALHDDFTIVYTGDYCNDNPIAKVICGVCNDVVSTFGHSYAIESMAATCEIDGYQLYTCLECNDTYKNVIEAYGHIKGEEIIESSSCKEHGHSSIYCLNCNILLSSIELEYSSHQYISKIENNKIIYTCKVCNDSYEETFDGEYFTVSFVTNCDTELKDIYVKYGGVVETTKLNKKNHVFIGWYLDEKFVIPYKGQYIYENTCLYARFDEEYIKGTYSDNLILLNVSTDYEFKIITELSSIEDIEKNINILNSNDERITFNISKISDSKYNILLNNLAPGNIYHVILGNNIFMEGYDNISEFSFMVESEEYRNILYKDNVIQIDESNVILNNKSVDGNYIILNDCSLNVNDIFVITGNNEMVLGIYKVYKIINDTNYDVYLCSAPNFNDVFEKFEMYSNDDIMIADTYFLSTYEDSLINSFKRTKLHNQINAAFNEFGRRNSYKKFNIEIDSLCDIIDNKKIQIGIKVTGVFKNDNNEYIKIIVSLVDIVSINSKFYFNDLSLNSSITISNSFNMDIYVLNGAGYGTTENFDEVSKIRFLGILNKIIDNGLDEIKKPDTTDSDEIVIDKVPFIIFGVPMYIDIHAGYSWDIYGQIGIEAFLTTRYDILISFNLLKGISATTASYNELNCVINLGGKIDINPYIGLAFNVGVDNVFSLGVDFKIGPYVEAGGYSNLFISNEGIYDSNGGFYASTGLEGNIDLNMDVLGHIYTTNILESKFPLQEYGDKIAAIKIVEENNQYVINGDYNETIDLNKYISTKCIVQNFETLQVETKFVSCIYSIKEIVVGNRKYISFSDNKVIISPCYENEIVIIFMVWYKNLEFEREITIKINHKHNFNLIEMSPSKCGVEGYEKYSCKCGYSYNKYSPAIEHVYKDGKCFYCNYCPDEYTEGLIFSLVDGKYSVTNYIGKSETVIIPATYNGIIVNRVFITDANDTIKYLYLSENITTLSVYTLSFLKNLKYNTYNEGLYLGTKNNDYHFLVGTTNFRDIKFKTHPNTKVIIEEAFKNNHAITQIEISNSVKIIGNEAFLNCSKLTNVIFGDNVEIIGNEAFRKCVSLKSVTLPEKLSLIEQWAFLDCTSLTDVYMYDNVIRINSSAFGNCTKLTNVRLSSSLQQMSIDVFSSCDKLKYTIYKGVKYLGNEENPYLVVEEIVDRNVQSIEFHPNSKILLSYPDIRADIVTIPAHFRYIGNIGIYVGKKLILEGSTRFPPAAISTPYKNYIDVYFNGSAVDYVTSVTNLQGMFDSINKFYVKNQNNVYTELTNLVVDIDIDEIEYGKFQGCKSLKSVVITGNVKKINSYAFAYCSSLYSVELNGSNLTIASYAFSDSGLRTLILNDGVSKIDSRAFYNNSQLNSVRIMNDEIIIASDAFYNCKNIQGYTYDNGVYIGSKNNNYIMLIGPKSSYISSLTVNENTKIIADHAFTNLESLKSLNISNVQYIGQYAFYNCVNLESVSINCNNIILATSCFGECAKLKSVKLNSSSQAIIKDDCFENCTSLISVDLKNVIEIGNNAFSNCTSLVNFVMPDTVKNIGWGIFSYNTSLQNVKLSKNINGITASMFEGCKSLKTVDIPNNVTRISMYAFMNSGLERIYIPKSVTYIGGFAFTQDSLFSYIVVYCEHSNPPSEWDEYWDTGVNKIVWNYKK